MRCRFSLVVEAPVAGGQFDIQAASATSKGGEKMRPSGCFLLSVLLLGACTRVNPSLTEAERSLLDELGFDHKPLLTAKAFGDSLQRLMGTTEEVQTAPAPGVVLTTKPNRGPAVLAEVRAALKGSPYSAYLNDNTFGFGPDKIAILKSGDQYTYLGIVRTDAANYDMDHPRVLARYREWDKKYGLSLVGAGLDWLEAEFSRPPEDWLAFAKEVYEFCPDVVDQGTGDIPTLAREMRESNSVYLWWD